MFTTLLSTSVRIRTVFASTTTTTSLVPFFSLCFLFFFSAILRNLDLCQGLATELIASYAKVKEEFMRLLGLYDTFKAAGGSLEEIVP